MVTQEFDINIVPHGLPPRVEVDQYDTGLRTLIAHIYQDDTPLVMTDEYTYTVIGTKPSGTGFSYPATAENGAIVIDVTGQMTVVSGLVECGIIVWSGNNRVGTHRFNLWVQPSALQVETIIDSNDFDSIIEDAIQNALADAVNKTLPIDTASGAIASFPDGADNALVEDLTVAIVPKQAGSGTPSPSNVRAISGFTAANIVVSPTTDSADGTTYTISFGSAGTVYGGTLDVTTGVLTVTHRIAVLDGSSDETWGQNTSTRLFWLGNTATILPGRKASGDLVCDKAIKVPGTTTSEDWQIVYVSNFNIKTDESVTGNTVSAFKTWLASNPLTVVYELDTPIEVNLTPLDTIRTLYGANNIWSDTGDTTVTYRADTGLYIDKKIAEATA